MNGTKTETRRRPPRAKIPSDEVVYLNFPSGNGGVALDVSSDGLGFQVVHPLEREALVAFRLSVPRLPDLELSGNIMWLDETRKRGGMRLIVPAAAGPTLRQWQHKYLGASLPVGPSPASPQTSAPRAGQPTEVRQRQQKYLGASLPVGPSPASPQTSAPRAEQPTEARQQQPDGGALAARFSPQSLYPNPPARDPIFVSEWKLPPEERSGSRHILTVFVILVLCLGAAGFYYPGSRRQIGEFLIRAGQFIIGPTSPARPQLAATNAKAQTTEQPQVPASEPAASALPAPTSSTPGSPSSAQDGMPTAGSMSNSSDESAAPLPPAATPPQLARNAQAPAVGLPPSAGTVQSAAVPNDSQASAIGTDGPQPGLAMKARTTRKTQSVSAPSSASLDYGQADVALARRYLQNTNREDSAVAASLLWSAIGKGNTQAELILADLYIRGRGDVHRNCQQAEALLNAALLANVPGAAAKREELVTYGCR